MKEIVRNILPIEITYISSFMPFIISCNSLYIFKIIKETLIKIYGNSTITVLSLLPKEKVYNRKKISQYTIPINEIWNKDKKIIYYSRSLYNIQNIKHVFNKVSFTMWNNEKEIKPFNLIINLISYLPDGFGIIYLKTSKNDKCNNIYTKNYLPKKDTYLL